MMKQTILYTILALFAGADLWAQPGNNTCASALELTDLDNDCTTHPFADATFDLRNGSCAPAFARNVWFKFTAQGTDVDMSVTTPSGGPDAFVAIYDMQPPTCSPNTAFQIACDTNEITIGNALEVGQTYYINVTFSFNYQNFFTLCINNPEINLDPPNDYKCFPAPADFDGACLEGTTVDATFDFNNPFCPFADNRSVWYEGRLSSGKNILEVTVSNLEFASDVAIMIGTYPENNCIRSFDEILGFCFDSTGVAEFPNLSPGRQYFIMISHPEGFEQEFELCFAERGPSGGCAVNDLCTAPEILNLSTDDGELCVPGCNKFASFGPMEYSGTCYFMPSPTVWYQLTTDNESGFLRVKVTSDTLRFPKIAVFRGTECVMQDTFRCERGSSKELEFFMQVDQNTTYTLAFTDVSQDRGDFELCTELISDPQECSIRDTVYATSTSFGSPLEGPYQPGETVTFKYELLEWNKDNCNRLSAIVPTFGPAWDPSSFDGDRAPAIIEEPRPVSSGSWDWYPRGSARYNYDNPDKGYLEGTPISAGWFFVSNNAPPNDPNNSIGDGVGCDNDSTETWTASFRVTAFSSEDCPNGTMAPADVGVITFGDGEIGAGQYRGCALDEPLQLSTKVFCCDPPNFNISPTLRRLCSGESATIDFSNRPALEEVFWTVKQSQGLVSPDGGRGLLFSQQLFLIPGVPQGSVTFTFFPRDTLGCVGESVDVTYEVYLEVDAEAGQDITACEGELIQIGGNPTAGGGTGSNYQYVWTGNTPNEANPTIEVQPGTTTYTVRVIDQLVNCSAVDTMQVTGIPLPGIQLLPIDEVCVGQEGEINVEFFGEPPYNWTLQAGSFIDENFSNFTDDSYSVNFQQNQSFNVTAQLISDDNCVVNLVASESANILPPDESQEEVVLCDGESYEVNGLVFDRSGQYEIFIENPDPDECHEVLTLDLSILSEIVIQRRNEGVDDDDGGFIKVVMAGGLPPYTFEWSNGETTDSISNLDPGTYQLTVTDENDCMAEFEFMVMFTSTSNPLGLSTQVYPNPIRTGEYVNIQVDEPISQKVELIWSDSKGGVIREDRVDHPTRSLLQSKAPTHSGLYLLTIQTADGIPLSRQKIVVID